MKDKIIKYCSKKKGVTLVYPFGPETMVYKLGGKMFALLFEGRGDGLDLNLKCDPLIAANLREQHEAVRPGYHMNKEHWNTVRIDGSLPVSDIYDMIDHSYDLILQKLPKGVRESIKDRLV
ncbi:MmcQ/YjbR family DNA-binding protein [Paenibacillus chibensis]|uniref:MmcQ/YjbR family DNA-binding protein n=1 Tax=Paenibacillus chibensis TaxID=59846 RepID=A0ABU6PR51_9BACL|nr:MmcQ/YjbR family DNA-binding protein [Paenibacillus chibensis]